MAITSITQTRQLNVTTVTVVSDLSNQIFYHWYVDGAFVIQTGRPTRQFFLLEDEQVRIDVLDTNDADFDSIANAPAGFSARRTIHWVRSLSIDEQGEYRVEQQRAAEGYVAIAVKAHDARTWRYAVLSPRLDDLTVYTWRVIPVDAVGNDGPIIRTIGPETIVRRPDAPNVTATFDAGTTKVTFAEVA